MLHKSIGSKNNNKSWPRSRGLTFQHFFKEALRKQRESVEQPETISLVRCLSIVRVTHLHPAETNSERSRSAGRAFGHLPVPLLGRRVVAVLPRAHLQVQHARSFELGRGRHILQHQENCWRTEKDRNKNMNFINYKKKEKRKGLPSLKWGHRCVRRTSRLLLRGFYIGTRLSNNNDFARKKKETLRKKSAGQGRANLNAKFRPYNEKLGGFLDWIAANSVTPRRERKAKVLSNFLPVGPSEKLTRRCREKGEPITIHTHVLGALAGYIRWNAVNCRFSCSKKPGHS